VDEWNGFSNTAVQGHDGAGMMEQPALVLRLSDLSEHLIQPLRDHGFTEPNRLKNADIVSAKHTQVWMLMTGDLCEHEKDRQGAPHEGLRIPAVR
jgi:hypothetical protein